jgi:hypothetical protein
MQRLHFYVLISILVKIDILAKTVKGFISIITKSKYFGGFIPDMVDAPDIIPGVGCTHL